MGGNNLLHFLNISIINCEMNEIQSFGSTSWSHNIIDIENVEEIVTDRCL
jgi:hypothetical protein